MRADLCARLSTSPAVELEAQTLGAVVTNLLVAKQYKCSLLILACIVGLDWLHPKQLLVFEIDKGITADFAQSRVDAHRKVLVG
jgi:hypothetical protein